MFGSVVCVTGNLSYHCVKYIYIHVYLMVNCSLMYFMKIHVLCRLRMSLNNIANVTPAAVERDSMLCLYSGLSLDSASSVASRLLFY